MRKHIYHSFFFSCFSVAYIFGLSTPPSAEILALESVNQLVEVLNAETQRTWAIQKHLEQFNRDLLQSSENQPISLFGRLMGQQLEPDNSFEKLNYDLIRTATSQQSKVYQQELWKKIQQYQYIKSQIDDLIEALKPEVRCSEEVRRELMTYLQQVEALYGAQMDNHRHIRLLLQEGISHDASISNTPFSKPSMDLEQLVKESDQLLYMIHKGNSRSVESQVMVLRRALLKAETQSTTYQKILPAQPNSHRDPMTRYQSVLKQTRELLALAETYIGDPSVPSLYASYGDGYYYYNHLIGNKFNRQGDALVDQYHQFLDIGDATLPHQLISPNWYLVIDFPEEALEQVVQSSPEQAQTIVFLVDLSGSMRQPNKIDLFRKSFTASLQSLHAADHVSVVTYADNATVCLPPTPADQQQPILAAIDKLQVGGSGSPEGGMELAYEELKKGAEQQNQRIILITDGGFHIEQTLVSLLEIAKDRSIGLDIMYLGKEETKMRPRLERLAAIGGGKYAYLRSDRAPDILLKQLRRKEK